MKKLLILSPHFPPVNAADMHRVRQCLLYLRVCGWEPVVFAVEPECVEGARDELLVETLPADVEVHRVRALPTKWTRKVGLGNLGIRCWLPLRRAVDRYLEGHEVDLIFFSTTVFVTMALGPYWLRRYGVPFVLDLQDPWRNDYWLGRPRRERPRKFWFDYRLNRYLEKRTIPEAAGIVSVSPAYPEELCRRYPEAEAIPAITLPFGALALDFQLAEKQPPVRSDYSVIDVVYIGRGGEDMRLSLTAMFTAFRQGLEKDPQRFSRLRFTFIGTSYAPDGQGVQTVMPVARAVGVDNYVVEITDRLPYIASLKRLQEADLLFIPGSDDAGYTASKIYPYILAGKPILAIFHEQSSVVEILGKTKAGEIVSFKGDEAPETVSARLYPVLSSLIKRLPFTPATDWYAFEEYTARAMTGKLCTFFDQVVTPVEATR